jgi:hypothetical protein
LGTETSLSRLGPILLWSATNRVLKNRTEIVRKGKPVRQSAFLTLLCLCWLMPCASGCGLFGSGQQLKQLQSENDRLLAEYRAQRDRVTRLQETNAALEARVGEAERLLAQSGVSSPSSRISRVSPRSPAQEAGSGPPPATGSAPPYVPPSVPSLPATNPGADSNGTPVKWRPLRRP